MESSPSSIYSPIPSLPPLLQNIYVFRTDDFISGIFISLVDNNPYDILEVDILFGDLPLGKFNIPRLCEITDSYLGKDVAVFKLNFGPVKTTLPIKVFINTELIHNKFINIKLLTMERKRRRITN